jgi:GT2 family glycosyltransferase
MTRPHVTVAVPVKDRRERMLRCLDALLAQDYPSYEVLVLDNCSSDGTAEACRERASTAPVPVRVQVLPGTTGRLRNLAAKLARGEIVAFTDSDCMPAAGWLSGAVPAFERDPKLGVAQGTTLPEPGADLTLGWTATIEVTEWTGRFESCNLVVRRAALRACEGFEETVGHLWEDTAAGWSILLSGWRGAFAPEAVVYHDVTHPGLRWFLRRGLRYGNVAAVIRRHPEVRREILWCRYFLRPRNAKTVAAVVGVALAPWSRTALLLALPYAWFRRPRSLHLVRAARAAIEGTLFDLSILAGMVRGSIRHRTLVL